MAVKKSEVTYKQVGRNLKVIIDGEVSTRVGTKEELTPIKELALIAKEKPTKANIAKLVKAMKPVTTAKEVEKTKLKAVVKKAKNDDKKVKVESKESFTSLKSKLKDASLTDAEKKELRAMLQIEEPASTPVAKKVVSTRGEW